MVSIPSIRLSSIGNLGHFQPPRRMDNSPIIGVPPLYHLFRLLEDEDIDVTSESAATAANRWRQSYVKSSIRSPRGVVAEVGNATLPLTANEVWGGVKRSASTTRPSTVSAAAAVNATAVPTETTTTTTITTTTEKVTTTTAAATDSTSGVILQSQSTADSTENGSIENPNLIMTFIEENVNELEKFIDVAKNEMNELLTMIIDDEFNHPLNSIIQYRKRLDAIATDFSGPTVASTTRPSTVSAAAAVNATAVPTETTTTTTITTTTEKVTTTTAAATDSTSGPSSQFVSASLADAAALSGNSAVFYGSRQEPQTAKTTLNLELRDLRNPEYIQQLWEAPSVLYSLVLFVRPALREMERTLHSGGSDF
ncbi:hypothetical protein DAPPUDRAFT_264899 [Daphnia pulex]|uniref:Uncharacterized protein n=1 Tax=Daphnia pulex TaxID=6669 RepID=E9HSI8_DAPPU|nr:hypothetical protein DAPPUDRAFT_264899 [Daphnia pulex]|eukprot:EFX65301.1 hypothetical protein DAPPUDRAFT_264899 [Daphnia pulex]